MLARLFNGAIAQYPFTMSDLQGMYPNVSFEQPLSAARLAQHGLVEVVVAEVPEYNAYTHTHVPVSPILLADTWVQGWEIIPLSTEELVASKVTLKELIAEKRLEVMQLGFVYMFPDGQAGTVQIRNATDTGNVNGLVTAALVLTSQGFTDVFTYFKDEENALHPLTPSQAIEMGMAVSNYVISQYSVKWQKEVDLDACATVEEIAAFDINVGWGQA